MSLLGALRVTRGGSAIRLPPSRKTRALLAYLALTEREHSRDRLCAMFWDVADDPRGALRWSLSKLRGVMGGGSKSAIVADRQTVRLDATRCEVDLLQVRAALRNGLDQLAVESLQELAELHRGELLEGLDLADFDTYQAWCVAEREQTRQQRSRILSALVEKLSEAPLRALPHARSRVQVDPMNYDARVQLLKLALAAGRPDEAQQHYESGRRMMEELDPRRVGDLKHVWQRLGANGDGPTQGERALSGIDSPRVPVPASGQPPPDATAAMPGAGFAAPLVGRSVECARLTRALDTVCQRRSEQLWVIRGEPGVGKSRVLDALERDAAARSMVVLQAAAYEGETGRPYGPWLDALATLGAELPDAEGSGAEESDGADAFDGGRDRFFGSVSDRVAIRAHDGVGLLIAIEDVQWLDRDSCELLHYIARTSRHRPVFIALTARTEELADNTALTRALRSLRRDRFVHELELEPLDATAIGELLETVGAPHAADEVFSQSGGNPLFALELVRSGPSAERSLPSSLSDAVRDRVERLPQPAVDVLSWAAVLGTGFSVAQLEALMAMDLDDVVAALETLERHAIVRTDTTTSAQRYRFAHDVVRGVVYADLSEPRRRLMHRKAAVELQSRDDAEGALVPDIAHHATLGHDDDLAVSACLEAGRRCVKMFANEQALTVARRGMRHAERLGETDRIKRSIEFREIQFASAPRAEASEMREALDVLAEQALDQGLHEHARLAFLLLGNLGWEGGDWRDARRRMTQLELAGRGTTGEQRAIALAEAGRCLVMLERDLPQAHAMLLEAEAHARSLGVEPIAIADGIGMLAMHRGEPEKAAGLFERAGDLANAARDRMYQFHAAEHAAMLHLEQGRYAEVARLAACMAEIGDKLREGGEAPFARALSALASYGLGQDVAGELDAGFEGLREADAKHRLAYALDHTALIDLARGDAQAAWDRAAEALPIAKLLERPSETLLALAILVRAARQLDDVEAQEAYLREIDDRDWYGTAASVKTHCEELLGQWPGERTGKRTGERTEHADEGPVDGTWS